MMQQCVLLMIYLLIKSVAYVNLVPEDGGKIHRMELFSEIAQCCEVSAVPN